MKVPWVGSNHRTYAIATYCIWYRTMLGSVAPTPTRSCPLSVPTTHLIAVAESAGPAVQHGVELLRDALVERGRTAAATTLGEQVERPGADAVLVVVGERSTPAIAALEQQEWLLYTNGEPGPNGYYATMLPGRVVVVTGADANGVLYGCQELAALVRAHGEIPRDLDRGETPDLELRGPAIGLQRTEVEPPRQVYEYPITPDRFAWFYDRELWLELLDTLLEQRANVIYLWSGHPFASFVAPAEFPERSEEHTSELQSRGQLICRLVQEAGRRGVQLYLMFYNIHIPLPFATRHQIRLHHPRPTDLTSRNASTERQAFDAEPPPVE